MEVASKVLGLGDQAARLVGNFSKIIEGMYDGIKSIAPEVAAAVGRAIFWQNFIPVLTSLALLIVAFIIIKKLPGWCKYLNDNEDPEDTSVQLIISIILGIISIGNFLSVWTDSMTWMGIFDQKAYLAAEVLKKLTGGG